MKIVVYNRPTLDGAEARGLDDADAVLHISVADANPENGHAVVLLHVLRSKYGDPFVSRVFLDLTYRDPTNETEAVGRDREIAAALATLTRHGVHVASMPTLSAKHVFPSGPQIVDGATP